MPRIWYEVRVASSPDIPICFNTKDEVAAFEMGAAIGAGVTQDLPKYIVDKIERLFDNTKGK